MPRLWTPWPLAIAFVATAMAALGWSVLVRRTSGDRELAPERVAAVPRCGGVESEEYRAAIARARRRVVQFMLEREVPGMSVAVAVDGAPVWEEGFGYADIEQEKAACPVTRFRVASVSKPLTAAAMARLHDEGRIDLDAPVQRYVPGFPNTGSPITARQLASHRSGIRHYRDDWESVNTQRYDDVVDSLEKFKNDPLLFEPGSDFSYTSYGYVLLSALLQGAAREDFLSYIERSVFEPLGMRNTSAEHAALEAPHQSRFYDHVTPYSLDGRIVASPYNDFSSKWAAGGFLSTAEDLVRFGSALLPGRTPAFLREDTRSVLFRPQSRQLIMGYTLGWMTMHDLQLRRLYFHFGAGAGATSFLAVYPNERVVVAVLANLGHAGLTYGGTMGIAGLFMPTGPRVPAAFMVVFLISWIFAGLTLQGLRVAGVWPRHHRIQPANRNNRDAAVPGDGTA